MSILVSVGILKGFCRVNSNNFCFKRSSFKTLHIDSVCQIKCLHFYFLSIPRGDLNVANQYVLQ
jgi:hypothetical protein